MGLMFNRHEHDWAWKRKRQAKYHRPSIQERDGELVMVLKEGYVYQKVCTECGETKWAQTPDTTKEYVFTPDEENEVESDFERVDDVHYEKK